MEPPPRSRHGTTAPLTDLPASPPVRVCAQCALRRSNRAISRSARAALCVFCEADYDFPDEEPTAGLPPGRARRLAGAPAPGLRVCPRCRKSVPTAGYSWQHHMRCVVTCLPSPW